MIRYFLFASLAFIGVASGEGLRIAAYKISFLDAYPACRDLNEALNPKLAASLAKEGQIVFQNWKLQDDLARTQPNVYPKEWRNIPPNFEHDTRCLVVGGGSSLSYPVIENPPKPDGAAEVPTGKAAICVIFGTKPTREQPCSWVIANPQRVLQVRDAR